MHSLEVYCPRVYHAPGRAATRSCVRADARRLRSTRSSTVSGGSHVPSSLARRPHRRKPRCPAPWSGRAGLRWGWRRTGRCGCVDGVGGDTGRGLRHARVRAARHRRRRLPRVEHRRRPVGAGRQRLHLPPVAGRAGARARVDRRGGQRRDAQRPEGDGDPGRYAVRGGHRLPASLRSGDRCAQEGRVPEERDVPQRRRDLGGRLGVLHGLGARRRRPKASPPRGRTPSIG